QSEWVHRLQAALGRTLSKNESEALTGLLSKELVSSAIAAWFPHLTAEITDLRAGKKQSTAPSKPGAATPLSPTLSPTLSNPSSNPSSNPLSPPDAVKP